MSKIHLAPVCVRSLEPRWSWQVQDHCCRFAGALAADSKLHVLLSQIGWIQLLINVLKARARPGPRKST